MTDRDTTYSKIEIEIADYIFGNPGKKREDILSYFVALCRKNRRTVERYYKKAIEYNTIRQNKIEQIKDEALTDNARKLTKSAIISRCEALEILTRISTSTENTAQERISAIRIMADIEGWKAPIKNEHTGKDGSPIEHAHTIQDHKVIFENYEGD